MGPMFIEGTNSGVQIGVVGLVVVGLVVVGTSVVGAGVVGLVVVGLVSCGCWGGRTCRRWTSRFPRLAVVANFCLAGLGDGLGGFGRCSAGLGRCLAGLGLGKSLCTGVR